MSTKSRIMRPIKLILDFDGTITKKDTLHLVAKAGYDVQKRSNKPTTPTSWAGIVEAYLSDFASHESHYRPSRQFRKTLQDESRWLGSLRSVEIASVNRVYEAGVFDDVASRDVRAAASQAVRSGQVHIRPGLFELLSLVDKFNESNTSIQKDSMVQILSVNWSRCFIRSVLRAAATASSRNPDDVDSEFITDLLERVSIFANELPSAVDETDRSSLSHDDRGNPVELRTSGDKLQCMHRGVSVGDNVSDDTLDSLTVYIGDSTTDLQCLAAADVGICVRDDSMGSGQRELAETCERLGILVKHISHNGSEAGKCEEGGGKEKQEQKNTMKLWWVTDFTEVASWLSNLFDATSAEDRAGIQS